MFEHAVLGECSRCRQLHCIEGSPPDPRALRLLCHHHGISREADLRAKVCTDCGYVEFWVRQPAALKLNSEALAAADAAQSAAAGHADW